VSVNIHNVMDWRRWRSDSIRHIAVSFYKEDTSKVIPIGSQGYLSFWSVLRSVYGHKKVVHCH
jgi:hypothetical protein